MLPFACLGNVFCYTLPMKKIILLLLILFLFNPQSVKANGAGLPPFFKINGTLANPNPLQAYGITASSFLIPQDLAPENYNVNEAIAFEIDETALKPVVGDTLKRVEYAWDFGDGTKSDGLKNSHTYTKTGSYILILTINLYTQNNHIPTQFVDSFLIHVVPYKNYNTLPTALIKVNGKVVEDPLTETLDIDLSSPIAFDASDSHSSSEIVEYIWNFGDDQTATKKTITHTYDQVYYVTAVLRVRDKSGFIGESFVEMRNKKNDSSPIAQTGFPKLKTPQIAGLFGVGLIGIVLLYLKKKR